MNGKEHVIINFFFFFPLYILFYETNKLLLNISLTKNLIFILTLIFFILLGSLCPDIDYEEGTFLNNVKIFYKLCKKSYENLISHYNKKFKYVNNEHRGITHSWRGILFLTLNFLLKIILYIFLIIFFTLFLVHLINKNLNIFTLFLESIYYFSQFILISFIGLFLGMFLHIIEDSMTIQGIPFWYPISKKRIEGKIKNTKKDNIYFKDKRPKYYYLTFMITLFLFIFTFLIYNLFFNYNKNTYITLILLYLSINIILIIISFYISKLDSKNFLKKVN